MTRETQTRWKGKRKTTERTTERKKDEQGRMITDLTYACTATHTLSTKSTINIKQETLTQIPASSEFPE